MHNFPNPFDKPKGKIGKKKPPLGGRNSQRPTNQRVKPKSKSNLEKVGGYAYGAAKGITKAEIAGLKSLGGYLMPQRRSQPRVQKMSNLSPNMPSNRLPKPASYKKKKPLRAGVDTRPTERDSQTKKYKYGPPRTARDLELAPRPRPRPKNPKQKTRPSYNFGPPKRKKLGVYKPKKGM